MAVGWVAYRWGVELSYMNQYMYDWDRVERMLYVGEVCNGAGALAAKRKTSRLKIQIDKSHPFFHGGIQSLVLALWK